MTKLCKRWSLRKKCHYFFIFSLFRFVLFSFPKSCLYWTIEKISEKVIPILANDSQFIAKNSKFLNITPESVLYVNSNKQKNNVFNVIKIHVEMLIARICKQWNYVLFNWCRLKLFSWAFRTKCFSFSLLYFYPLGLCLSTLPLNLVLTNLFLFFLPH